MSFIFVSLNCRACSTDSSSLFFRSVAIYKAESEKESFFFAGFREMLLTTNAIEFKFIQNYLSFFVFERKKKKSSKNKSRPRHLHFQKSKLFLAFQFSFSLSSSLSLFFSHSLSLSLSLSQLRTIKLKAFTKISP